MLDWQIHSF